MPRERDTIQGHAQPPCCKRSIHARHILACDVRAGVQSQHAGVCCTVVELCCLLHSIYHAHRFAKCCRHVPGIYSTFKRSIGYLCITCTIQLVSGGHAGACCESEAHARDQGYFGQATTPHDTIAAYSSIDIKVAPARSEVALARGMSEGNMLRKQKAGESPEQRL